MDYRRATIHDIDAMVENRMEFVTSIRDLKDAESFKVKTKEYLVQHISKDDLVIFIAVDNGQIVASCMACLYETIPRPTCLSGKSADLLNVYTNKAYRRQGHAEKLIRLLMAEVKKLGAEKMVLTYTQEGYPLYQKLGFQPLDHQMEIRLQE